MNISIETYLDLEKTGKALAHGSDKEQGKVINFFASELNVICEDNTKKNMQICYISDELNKSAQQFILDLADFVKMRQKEEQS